VNKFFAIFRRLVLSKQLTLKKSLICTQFVYTVVWVHKRFYVKIADHNWQISSDCCANIKVKKYDQTTIFRHPFSELSVFL
jgi:hypothetical protein